MGANKKIKELQELIEKGKKLKLDKASYEYGQWHEQAERTLRLLFGENSKEVFQFIHQMRSYKYLTKELTEEESNKRLQEIYGKFLKDDIEYLEKLIKGLEKEIEIRQKFRVEIASRNVSQYLRKFWQETVKAAFEGIFDSLRKRN